VTTTEGHCIAVSQQPPVKTIRLNKCSYATRHVCNTLMTLMESARAKNMLIL